MGCSKSSSKREVYSNTILPQGTRKISNKQPNLTPKAIRERRTKKPKVNRRKEIIKIRSEINEKEMKETIAKINKTKNWFFEKINKIDKALARLIKKRREKGFPGGTVVENLPTNAGDTGSSPGLGRSHMPWSN